MLGEEKVDEEEAVLIQSMLVLVLLFLFLLCVMTEWLLCVIGVLDMNIALFLQHVDQHLPLPLHFSLLPFFHTLPFHPSHFSPVPMLHALPTHSLPLPSMCGSLADTHTHPTSSLLPVSLSLSVSMCTASQQCETVHPVSLRSAASLTIFLSVCTASLFYLSLCMALQTETIHHTGTEEAHSSLKELQSIPLMMTVATEIAVLLLYSLAFLI